MAGVECLTDNQPATPLGNVYSLNEAAAKLRMSRRAMQDMIKRLPFYSKNGRVYLFSDDDIMKIWEGMREESNERLRLLSMPQLPRKRTYRPTSDIHYRLKKILKARETALTHGPYRSGEFSFKAFAFFGNAAKKLEYVQLDLNDPSLAYKLLGELKSKYGEPTSQSNSQLSTIASWRGGADQVQVFILGMGGHPTYATITYRPRQSRSNKGL